MSLILGIVRQNLQAAHYIQYRFIVLWHSVVYILADLGIVGNAAPGLEVTCEIIIFVLVTGFRSFRLCNSCI